MSALHSSGSFCRLVEVLLPNGGGIAAMYEGYFDESGDLENSDKFFCIAGYYVEADNAKRMDAEWLNVLSEHGLPYFHMVDCAHGNDEFERIARSDRSEIVIKLIKIIKEYTSHGFAVIANGDHLATKADQPDVYSECAELCINALHVFLLSNRLEGNMAYFFETGHKSRGNAYNHVARRISELSSSITFAKKEQVRLLQAADLLAWQSAKYVKDMHGQKRPPRKDFMSLLEHPHTLAFLSVKGAEKQIAFEDWPLSRRGTTTILMEVNKDGPITILNEGGSQVPIIPVDKLIGWRMGAGRMAYVGFADSNNKAFILAFDNLRLNEAVVGIVNALEVYPESPGSPAFDVSHVELESFGAGKVLRIEMPNGASLAFRLPKEISSKLKMED